jgi:hypothetical protein
VDRPIVEDSEVVLVDVVAAVAVEVAVDVAAEVAVEVVVKTKRNGFL